MWQSIIAILGTLAGASVTAWFQQRGQRAEPPPQRPPRTAGTRWTP
ncbi:hypothetical protein [Streptomyces sp. 2133.1]|nr:hypothetical protein [Streptomyces sp. 2133.1]SEE48433.1 hypothetical protein SAMN05428940_7252 [Streptomyces sp. 2133.1]